MNHTHQHENKRAIILLAGTGSRLKPLTDHTHKTLIPVGETNILDRQIRQLTQYGIEDFYLILGYRAEDIKTFIQDNYPAKVHFNFCLNEKYSQTNTAYSLMLALENFSSRFILVDGDVILDDPLVECLCREKNENLLLSDTQTERLNAEAVKFLINDKNEITTIGKNIPLHQAAGESIGVGLYQKDWAVALKEHLRKKMQSRDYWQWYYEDAIQDLIAENKAPSTLKIVSTGDFRWVEIDDHDDLKLAKRLFGGLSSP